jgi:integral membrane protein
MKSLIQSFWILFFFALGELISMLIGHFLPGSVIGLILLFAALETKLIKPEKVDSVSKFLTLNMGLFFVPAGVGLITQLDLIKRYWPAIVISMIVSTALVLIVVGRMQHRFEMRHQRSKS